ncbi:LPD11 domain-containing protein [Arcanobacterium hippocoleae]|uniref:Large polyvalent protein-associated domain-containing protein n=1 Tax=Arcanobacterium hippocoleae TaxID=149017 RepID=A0ABU1T1J6_9ACTO|nr:LPD11 domain-containing protein [Arcanobacterium hippocoleae]MDR6939235.1 hypothetical protein [Arcanobacterium hippocoleae]
MTNLDTLETVPKGFTVIEVDLGDFGGQNADSGVYMIFSDDLADSLAVRGEQADRLEVDTIKDEIRNRLIEHFEEMYGEENEFIYEMADKVIDSNFTMVNPCVMHVATANIVNEKGYEQAFEDQWKDYLIEHRCSAINASDLIHYYNFLDRLQSDCKYYLGACVEDQVDMVIAQKHLWAGTIEGQIDKMREIYENLPENEKPVWLSLSDINEYEKKMLAARDKNIPSHNKISQSLSSLVKETQNASDSLRQDNAQNRNNSHER